jgi:catechol 2,3-dioxygenase-like lactoylglutathione lyase family enzyme
MKPCRRDGRAQRAPFLLSQVSLVRLATAVLLLLLPLAGHSKPVEEEARIPLDLRRTTLVVRDLERSLALYRDALGMRLTYDNVIRTPRDAPDDAAAERSLHLAFLQANDDFVGVLGLLEYTKPRKSRPVVEQAFEPGTPVLVFNIDDLDQRWEAVTAIPGVKVLDEPEITSYPSYDGSGVIRVRVSVIMDPDGFVLELNQLLSELH